MNFVAFCSIIQGKKQEEAEQEADSVSLVPREPVGLHVRQRSDQNGSGTTIGFNADSNEYYISIVDPQRKYYDQVWIRGQKRVMMPIDKPRRK